MICDKLQNILSHENLEGEQFGAMLFYLDVLIAQGQVDPGLASLNL